MIFNDSPLALEKLCALSFLVIARISDKRRAMLTLFQHVRTEMRTLLLIFSILQCLLCSCPSGFDLVAEGQCRGLYEVIENARWDDAWNTAITKCKEILSQPIIIHNDEQQQYWANAIKSLTSFNPVLGIVCNSGTKRWEWADGTTIDYKPMTYGTELDQECKTQYTWEMINEGEWAGYGTQFFETVNFFQLSIFCTYQILQPFPSAEGCVSFEDDSEDGVCYQISGTAKSWQDAQLICSKIGANLASIHSENSFVRRLAVSKGAVNGVFLGATLSGKGKDFGWIDGSDWDYQNFHSGFPIPGAGDCLAMDTSTSSGLWMNMDCAAELPVACVRDQKPVVEPTCSDGPWEEGKIITSPGFPHNSSVPCDFFLVVDVGMKIKVEIVFLQANSCCDSLIIYDGYLGGHVLANLTGEIGKDSVHSYNSTSNTMKISWAPNGGVNVRGMAFAYYAVY